MAKGKKRKDLNIGDIKSYKHEKDNRKYAVPVGLASYDIAKSLDEIIGSRQSH